MPAMPGVKVEGEILEEAEGEWLTLTQRRSPRFDRFPKSRPREIKDRSNNEEVNMLRFDPLRELDRFARETRDRTPSVMAFDAVRNEDAVTLYFDVPGVSADDLEVNVDRNQLTITAERIWQSGDDEILVSERPQGTFTRRVMLSESLDTEKLEANLDEGVLTVSVPVAEKSKPRKIDVSTGSQESDSINVSSSDEG